MGILKLAPSQAAHCCSKGSSWVCSTECPQFVCGISLGLVGSRARRREFLQNSLLKAVASPSKHATKVRKWELLVWLHMCSSATTSCIMNAPCTPFLLHTRLLMLGCAQQKQANKPTRFAQCSADPAPIPVLPWPCRWAGDDAAASSTVAGCSDLLKPENILQ